MHGVSIALLLLLCMKKNDEPNMGKALTSPETETQAQESVFGIKGSAPSHWLLSQVNTSPRNCALAWWGVRGCTCCMCWVTMFNHCWCRWRPKSRVGIYSWISWLMAENKRPLVYRRGSLCYLRDLSQVLFSIWTITINTTLCFYNCAVFDLYTIMWTDLFKVTHFSLIPSIDPWDCISLQVSAWRAGN